MFVKEETGQLQSHPSVVTNLAELSVHSVTSHNVDFQHTLKEAASKISKDGILDTDY